MKNYYHKPPAESFRDRREALRVLRQTVRDEMEWFGEIQPETKALARQVFKRYLRGKATRPQVRRRSVAFGKAGRAMRFEGV